MNAIYRAVLVVATVAAAMALAAPSASAQTWSPPGDGWQATAGVTTLTAGSTSVQCATSDASGVLPSPASSLADIGPPAPSFNGPCDVLAGGVDVGDATVTTSGTWQLEAVSTTRANILVPEGGAVVNTTLGCSITVNESTVGQDGDWTNGSGGSPSMLTLDDAGVVNITGSNPPCPSGTATFDGDYQVVDTSDPNASITIQP